MGLEETKNTNYIKDLKIVAILGIVIFLFVEIFLDRDTYYAEQRKEKHKQEVEERKKAEEASKQTHSNTDGAWAYIQIYVKKQLKSPKSANFPFGGSRHVTHLGSNLYSFNSYVDATNSFGANLRSNFSGTIQKTSEGWTIQSFSMK